MSTAQKISGMDPDKLQVSFPAETRLAFTCLADAVQSSPHFDQDMLLTLRDWSAGKPASLSDFMTGLTGIADAVGDYKRAAEVDKATVAWIGVKEALRETDGFTLTNPRVRVR